MRVVMIRTNGVNPDPRVEKEVNSIVKDGENDVTVLAWDRESDQDTVDSLVLSNGEARIVRFGVPSEWGGGFKKNLLPLLTFSKKVHSWLKKNENEYDCLHCCDLPTAMMASPYIKKKYFVYDIYDYFADTAHAPEIVLKYARKKEKQMIEIADATIICSEQREKQIGDAKPKKLVVIHNSPEATLLNNSITRAKRIIENPSDKNKIVYVGNLIEERYIDVVAELVAQNPNIEFHVGGMGPLSGKLQHYSEKHDNIFYYGKMKYADVISLERECDIMLALYDPSVLNNQFAAPNKFYEGLLVGKPIVMIKNTGMDEIVEKEKIGAVAATADREDLWTAIQKAVDIKASKADIGSQMRKIYDKYYSWEIMDRRLSELYKSLKVSKNA